LAEREFKREFKVEVKRERERSRERERLSAVYVWKVGTNVNDLSQNILLSSFFARLLDCLQIHQMTNLRKRTRYQQREDEHTEKDIENQRDRDIETETKETYTHAQINNTHTHTHARTLRTIPRISGVFLWSIRWWGFRRPRAAKDLTTGGL
jgi:ABC-type Zn2+ transport system substrate-binding protein/surface adhesin